MIIAPQKYSVAIRPPSCSLACLRDVRRCKGREDQSLDRARKHAEGHDGQGDDKWHQERQHCDGELVRQDVAEEPEAQAQGLR
eukprot:CAMPEP_0168371312 /NCGR_PEP_ID=MMETSP0228-20121227/7707_1 /TAXON_ID=133427 /ORGANISM="Protoceratium reticulatum, Strain CCCM 535 (=CCMP 1889)" /LENGTH=82 /DNA_ID=CAMNT_0008384197 /DNA_START=15 /DNA_END=260 /DNA_ORIENTATION=-